jgi:OmpA-OmpF porin, OOP family
VTRIAAISQRRKTKGIKIMRHSVSSLAFLAALAVSSTAFAQEQPTGLYIGGGIGASMPSDAKISGPGVNTDAELDKFVAAMATLGYSYSNNLRSEIELSWRKNDVGSVGTSNGSGDVTTWTPMMNLMYDFKGLGAWTPYIGGGIGLAHIDIDGARPVDSSTMSGDEWAFAYQGIAGVGYQMTDNLGLFADYRYLDTSEANFKTAAGKELGTDFTEHRVMVGLRWFFGAPAKPAAAPAPMPVAAPAPAPAPAAAPAPAPARNYIVFFDFDKADLKSDAQTVVRQAAAGFKNSQGVTRIEATGHADRSGTPAYNMKLSERRAEAVRAELIAQGVPANAITIAAKGETQPLVQTADGVREPQNRRVEIVLR